MTTATITSPTRLESADHVCSIISAIILILGVGYAGLHLTRNRVERSWAIVWQARGHAGDGGRSKAVEYINEKSSFLFFFFKKERLPLDSIDLQNATISSIDLTGASLRNADFTNARLTDIDFSGADLEGAKFDGCILRRIKLDKIINQDHSQLLNAETIDAISSMPQKLEEQCLSFQGLGKKCFELTRAQRTQLAQDLWYGRQKP